MRDDRTPLRNQLHDLEVAAEAAEQRSVVALERLRNERTEAAVSRRAGAGGFAYSKTGERVFAPLTSYQEAIHYERPDAMPPERRDAEERRITDEIVAEVQRRGLVFSPNGDGFSVTLVDPSLKAAADAADAESRQAKGAVAAFIRENAAAMAEESERKNQADFAAAIRANDVESVAGILRLTNEKKAQRTAALTSADLPN